MRVFVRLLLLFGVVIALNACGGGGGSSGSTASASPAAAAGSSPSGLVTIKPGDTWTMVANSSVLVPSGAKISWNGTVVTVNGSSNTIYTQAGALVNVPLSDTAAANNTVSTAQATAGSTTTATPIVTALAGSATSYSTAQVDGTGAAAVFWGQGDVAIDGSGNIIVADNGGLRKVTPAGVVTTLLQDNQPVNWEGIAVDAAGNIFGSANTSLTGGASGLGASINELTTAGLVKNIATNWETSATNVPVAYVGLAVDSKGNLFQTDELNNRIVKFTPDGVMSVFAGSGTAGNADGVGTSATFNWPFDLVIDGSDNLYVSSSYHNANIIRKITPDGTTSTFYTQSPSTSTISAIASDKLGNVYGWGSSGLFKILPNGTVISYSVSITTGFISSMAIDNNGNLYAETYGAGAQIMKISF